MATYVLVHGAGHGGWAYQRVARLLRAEGHDVHAPSLTGLGDRAHLLTQQTTLSTHIEDVVRLIEMEGLTDVILAGHSYGGMVITGAADRLPDRIAHLVFLDAAIPVDGECLADSSPGVRTMIYPEARMVGGVELILWPDQTATRAIQGVDDEVDWAWLRERLRPHPKRCFEEKLVLANPDAVLRIPRTIINCPSTLATRARHGDVERYHRGDRVWEIDTGHDLMITEPEKTTEMLLRLA